MVTNAQVERLRRKLVEGKTQEAPTAAAAAPVAAGFHPVSDDRARLLSGGEPGKAI